MDERRQVIEETTEKGIQLLRAVIGFQKGDVIEKLKRDFDDSLERLISTAGAEALAAIVRRDFVTNGPMRQAFVRELRDARGRMTRQW